MRSLLIGLFLAAGIIGVSAADGASLSFQFLSRENGAVVWPARAFAFPDSTACQAAKKSIEDFWGQTYLVVATCS